MKREPFIVINICIFFVTVLVIIISNFTSPRVVGVSFKTMKDNSVGVLDQQIKIGFTRPMNQRTAGHAFSIQPNVTGNVSWVNNTLYFTPIKPLRYNQEYRVRIDKSATDIYHKRLPGSFEESFRTQNGYFVYISSDTELHLMDLNGRSETIPNTFNIIDYKVASGTIAYIKDSGRDTNDVFLYDMATKKTTNILQNERAYYTQIQLSKDGQTIYVLPRMSPDQGNYGNTFISANLFTQLTKNIALSPVMGQLVSIWLLPDNNTMLLSLVGETDEIFFLHTIRNEEDVLLGKFTDYGGSDALGDKIVLSGAFASGNPSVILYNGQSKKISSDNESALFPNISYDGTMVSYSFQPLYSRDQKLGLKLIELDSKKIILNMTDNAYSLERSKISPDDNYLSFEKYPIDQHIISPYDQNPDMRQFTTIQILNLGTHKVLPFMVTGRYVTWIE